MAQVSWSITETGICRLGGVSGLSSSGSYCAVLVLKGFRRTYARSVITRLLCNLHIHTKSFVQCISLNNSFAERIRTSPIFELVTPPSFALSVFRLLPGSEGSNAKEFEIVNTLNRAFYSDLQARPGLALTQTLLGGVFCIRLAVGAARTEESDIGKAWETIKEVGENVLARMGLLS